MDPLTQEQKDLIVGTLLGDGNLQTETQGRTWRYRALHKAAHKPYIEHKYLCLRNLCTDPMPDKTGILYGEVKDDRTQTIVKRNYFNTRVLPCFRHYGNMFYTYDEYQQRFIKDVPQNIQQVLTPRAVAYLYQDDGALKWRGVSNAMRICTESFSLEGVTRLKTSLFNLYNINSVLHKVNKEGKLVGYRIYIPEASAGEFTSLIKPYLVDCMKYKVTDGKKGDLGDVS